MPVIGKQYTKKIELPNYPDDEKAYVVLLTNPKVGDWEEIDTENTKDSQYVILARMITEWNFVDTEGQPVPITPETIKAALSVFDITLISEQMTPPQLSTTEKKS